MFKKIKELYYKWKYRNGTPQNTVYAVVYRPDDKGLVRIESLHKTLKGAMKNRKELSDHFSQEYQVESYGMWNS